MNMEKKEMETIEDLWKASDNKFFEALNRAGDSIPEIVRAVEDMRKLNKRIGDLVTELKASFN